MDARKSTLYIVDGLTGAKTESGEELVLNAICFQQDPTIQYVYGVQYDYARRLPIDVFCRRVNDSEPRVQLVRRGDRSTFVVGSTSYALYCCKELEQICIDEGGQSSFWEMRQLEHLRSEDLSLAVRFAFYLRRMLD